MEATNQPTCESEDIYTALRTVQWMMCRSMSVLQWAASDHAHIRTGISRDRKGVGL